MKKAMLACGAIVALVVGAAAPAAVPGANGRIVLVRPFDGLGLVNSDGIGFVRLAERGALEPAFSPDGRRIAHAAPGSSGYDARVVGVDGTGGRLLTQTAGDDRDPSWSPDGARLAFESYRFRQQSDIFTIAVDGSEERRLTEDPAFDGDPAWSPDGTRIAFTSLRDGNKEIYVMAADGSAPQRLTNDGRAVADPANELVDENPQWSPDGRRLVFDSTRDGNFEVYAMNADGSGPVRLTDHPAIDANPSFSPDGRLVLFDSDRERRDVRDLYTVSAGGGAPTRRVVGPAEAAEWGVAVADPRGCTIIGTVGEDTIDGGPGADKICGLGGDDNLTGFGGSDFILGDAGDDQLNGVGGRDQLFGGAGDDDLSGGDERDFLYGEAGNDLLSGGAGADRLQGHTGIDTYRGGAGNDSLYARDARRETLDGGTGRDRAQADRSDRLRSIEKRF
jgi:hypothetical protein